ncbi:MAG: hypothetical protein HY567_04080 [Candidatus Kerfeldbacteria bacterium]|nr:hypothetical protein [Candidatus Kerfeldbacteria bacterium]
MCLVFVGSRNQLPPNSERPLFSVIESLLGSAYRSWTIGLTVEVNPNDVERLAIRARQEGVEQKLTLRPANATSEGWNLDVPEQLLTLLVINAAKNLRPNLAEYLLEPDLCEYGYENGMFSVTISFPAAERVSAGMLPMRSG